MTRTRKYTYLNPRNGSSEPAATGHQQLVFVERCTSRFEGNLALDIALHQHPYVEHLVERLIRTSIAGLLSADTEKIESGSYRYFDDTFFSRYDFRDHFRRTDPDGVLASEPIKEIEFGSASAYGVYNWELFFHVPLTVAIHLSRSQRFAEAQNWFHFIFNPMTNEEGDSPARFWGLKPFRESEVKTIERILVNLVTDGDPKLADETLKSLAAWEERPFRPHLVARYRPTAYMVKTLMAYLDNLISWGDALFRQDTRETINEATQLYVMAANILGRRPQQVPDKGKVAAQTYKQLRGKLGEFSTILNDVEANLGFELKLPSGPAAAPEGAATLKGLGKTLYFCIPKNRRLLSYWDTVADRLFKIRNSLNIRGIFRQLALFSPPIDPAMLARAAASGLDIASIVAGANQALPPVRFSFLVQKATELAQEVRSLGSNLLSTMEKHDAESLTLLRQKHERTMLGLGEIVRYGQWQEAIKSREGIQISLKNAIRRYTHFERLLGRSLEDIEGSIPELDPLDLTQLDDMKLTASEPELEFRDVKYKLAEGLDEELKDLGLSPREKKELEKMDKAKKAQDVAGGLAGTAAVIGFLPNFGIKYQPMGGGGDATFGGSTIVGALRASADVSRSMSARSSAEASKASRVAGHERRARDWEFQSNSAAGEITQLFKQLRGVELREALAEREWKNHQQQIAHAEEIDEFLTDERKGKATNLDFYSWMRRELRRLHSQAFEQAFDVAKKAEQAFQYELGDTQRSFIRFDYRAGKEGLLSGEKLFSDLKRMEMSYHELNEREYELTQRVSLLQLDPLALVRLRETGRCEVVVPESLFDLHCPGHYFRRIKTVSASIPGVTGPNVGVHCTLSMSRSTIRISPAGDYARDGDGDERFRDDHRTQSIVTSSSVNDPGLFEPNLRDERYLPFEGRGVESLWSIRLAADPSEGDPQTFDYSSIADVVLVLRYTAREGGELLRDSARSHIATRIENAEAVGSVRLFSVRHEFPGAWAQFKSAVEENGWYRLTLRLRAEHYPYWSRNRLGKIKKLEVVAESESDVTLANSTEFSPGGTAPPDSQHKTAALAKQDYGELRVGTLEESAFPLPPPITAENDPYTLYVDDNTINNLWVALAWGK